MQSLKKYPNLKFLIKPEEDVLVYFAFEKEAKVFEKSSKILESCFFKKHPKIRILRRMQNEKKKREFLEKYVTNYYKSHKGWIKKGVWRAERKWKNIQKRFFSLTDEFFQKHPWPKGNYRGFVTIWGIFPRNIKQKVFQFPYKGRTTKKAEAIIAHEMLHFLFL